MTPAERAQALANRSEYNRKYLESRLQEFESLTPVQREARLNQLELSWWLPMLMRLAPTNRTQRLEMVPPYLLPVIQERLKQWDLLPSKVQREVLDYETTANYFLRAKPVPTAAPGTSPGSVRLPPSDPGEQKEMMAQKVGQFFDLPVHEQKKTLQALPEPERAQMEDTIEAFSKLAPEQRSACVNSFEKLSRMRADERSQFLKNAERWKAMSPRERETWRTLVKILPPGSMVSNFPPALPTTPETGGSVTASPPDLPSTK
jgi:hypothetical protein